MVALRRAEIAMLAVAGIAAVLVIGMYGFIIGPGPCPIPVPPILLRVVAGSDELVFLTQYSTYMYAEGWPHAPVADLRFELAEYHPGDNYSGPGTLFRSGPLASLSRNGSFQFHDMGTEGEFSPGNDFFILLNPPAATVQLRILPPNGTPIAWNMIMGCI